LSGGGREIRTLEQVAPLLVFKTSAFNRSATPPEIFLLTTDLFWESLRVGILPKREVNIYSGGTDQFFIKFSLFTLQNLYMLTNMVFRKLPSIHDITTDVNDPPEFTVARQTRSRWQNSAEYAGARISALQQQAYPEIVPIICDLPPEAAFSSVSKIAQDLGWTILVENPEAGQIEAVDVTPIFRFRDDIVIRIRAYNEGSRLDIRSASRLGRSDLGMNAKRIRKFIRYFNQEL